MRFIRQEGLKVSHHSARFGGHGHSGSGHVMVLTCHVILQEHVIKESCVFNEIHNPAIFDKDRHCSSGDMILICHVISNDHVIKGSCDF